MTTEQTLEIKRADLKAAIEHALNLADELGQQMTGAYLDQAMNAALAHERGRSD